MPYIWEKGIKKFIEWNKLAIIKEVPFEKYKGFQYGKIPQLFWSDIVPIKNNPIEYLEIGLCYGANFFHVANSYRIHPNSKLYGIDPFIDYDNYKDLIGKQDSNYDNFLENLENSRVKNKCIIYRDFSDNILPTFSNNKFDIVFIDGNHETDYVYRDGILASQKVKIGGYIIFDDYD